MMIVNYEKVGSVIRKVIPLKRNISAHLPNDGFLAPYKMVYFVGAKGVDFLNASLFSVYRSFKNLPELIIVSDGTPAALIKEKMLVWPRKTEIISWEQCAGYYKNKGNLDLYKYANEDLWGKKLVAILYCAEQYKILYSDTDVLWYSDPIPSLKMDNDKYIKMCLDEDFSYAEEMVNELGEQHIFLSRPFNAGIIYAHGDFSTFPKWEKLSNYLSELSNKNIKKRGWTEQTAFAILNNYFGTHWKKNEMLLEINDHNSFFNKYKREYREIYARHYVTTKGWLFWRDYLYYFVLSHKTYKR